MNPFARFIGCVAVIGRLPKWESYFDLSKNALRWCFLTQILVLPAIYLIARQASQGRAEMLGTEASEINAAVVGIIGLVYLFSFSAVAYILTMVFDRQDRLRPWIIVRHWCVFFLAWIAALGFALFSFGLLPLAAAYGVLFAAYMGLLFVDIRLAQRIVGFDLGGAVLAGCLISVTAISLLLTSLSQFI